jgi:hypothetical protein
MTRKIETGKTTVPFFISVLAIKIPGKIIEREKKFLR